MFDCLSLRVIFAGTPCFAAHHLDVLIRNKYQLVGVFTQPDRPSGRGNRLKSSPVKQLAQKHNLPLFQPLSLDDINEQISIAKLKPDIMIVVAYGLFLPRAVLTLPHFGCINVHGSILPRWRGAAPIQRALCAGDKQTGITIIKMNSSLDAGDILNQVCCDIKFNDTSVSLYNKLAKIGSDTLLKTLKLIVIGNIVAKPQDNTISTYANKINKKEAKINWNLPAKQLECNIRAFNPWPISYFLLSEKRIKVWAAEVHSKIVDSSPGTIITVDKSGIHVNTCNGVLILTKLQLVGKKVISVQELLNSHRKWFKPGIVLG